MERGRTAKDQPRVGESASSGLTPEERDRSLLLPTTDEAASSVPRERARGPETEYVDSDETDTISSTIEYLENPTVDLIASGGSSLCVLNDAATLASKTDLCSFVVNVDGRDVHLSPMKKLDVLL